MNRKSDRKEDHQSNIHTHTVFGCFGYCGSNIHTLEQFITYCSPWGGLTLEKFIESCLLWEGSHTGEGDNSQEQGEAETAGNKLTTAPISCHSVLLGEGHRELEIMLH